MQTSKIIYKGHLRTEATHLKSQQIIVTDAPVDNEGKGEAFSPTDLLATSLASCMITVMGIHARKSNFDLSVSANMLKHMGSNPRRISAIDIELTFTGLLDETQKKVLEQLALNCPVAKSLHPSIEQRIRFIYK